MALARARHWKQHEWAKSGAERGTIPGMFGTLALCSYRTGLLQQNRNGSVANVDGKQASCGWWEVKNLCLSVRVGIPAAWGGGEERGGCPRRVEVEAHSQIIRGDRLALRGDLCASPTT